MMHVYDARPAQSSVMRLWECHFLRMTVIILQFHASFDRVHMGETAIASAWSLLGSQDHRVAAIMTLRLQCRGAATVSRSVWVNWKKISTDCVDCAILSAVCGHPEHLDSFLWYRRIESTADPQQWNFPLFGDGGSRRSRGSRMREVSHRGYEEVRVRTMHRRASQRIVVRLRFRLEVKKSGGENWR